MCMFWEKKQRKKKSHELLELRQTELDSIIVRSRAKWLYEGEKSNLEKRNFVPKAMCFIQKENGDIVLDGDVITKAGKHLYENVYASRENEVVKLDVGNLINT